MSVPLFTRHRQQLAAANRAEYGDLYPRLTFGTSEFLAVAEELRGKRLRELGAGVETGCRGTKLDMRRLSPGCRICIEGAWSCLFINGRCNARCFYCPTGQDEVGVPTTNTVDFGRAADYVAYLQRFEFRGASFSGGEPLLTPDRTLGYLAAVKRRFGDALHTWLYTNGTLVDRDILLRLRDAGLDEIRFDIGAVGYALDAPRLAAGIIPTVTVEIPAVPEEVGRLKALMVAMADAGIDHLNLHQMRLTPYNLPRLSGRRYTFLHGEKVTVMESELAALELLCHARQAGIDLPVNYCSFVYKHRFQRAAARRRAGAVMQNGHEALTPAGYIRTLALLGAPEEISRQGVLFRDAGGEGKAWSLSGGRLLFHPALLPLVDFSPFRLLVGYGEAAVRGAVSYRHAFTEVKLPTGRKVVVERWRSAEVELGGEEARRFVRLLGEEGEAVVSAAGALPEEIGRYEFVPAGLQDYF